MRPFYRWRQALASMRARMRPEDWNLVDQHLSPPEQSLFAAMQPPDQCHSVQVLQSLLLQGVSDRCLLKAALLHDVGKSRCHISVLHRSVAVLMKVLFGELPSFLYGRGESGWRLPFYVIANHPRVGADLMVQAGCEDRVWRLSELHQAHPASLGQFQDAEWLKRSLAALQLADNES